MTEADPKEIVANITAVIATLNRPLALGRCLGALLSGVQVPAEIIIVDQSEAMTLRQSSNKAVGLTSKSYTSSSLGVDSLRRGMRLSPVPPVR